MQAGEDFARFAARIGIIEEDAMRERVSETRQIAKMAFALAKSLKTEH